MDPSEIRLHMEQIARNLDRLDARLSHVEEMLDLRLSGLERAQADHETRLRTATETLTRLAAASSLAQAAQAALALILSAIAAWLGTRP